MTLLSNAKWNMASQFFKMLVQLINIIYLAKIIPPGEYGLMAMALVVVNLGILLRDLGTSAALIQRKDLSESLVNTVFWLNLLMGVGLFLIVFSSSSIISEIYNQPKLTLVLMLLSFSFPLSSCAAAHLALLERDSKFRIVSKIEISSSLLSLLVAITLANMGYGVYSLVGQAVTLNLISAVQFWMASKWRPSIRAFINIDDLKSIFGFSANLSLFNLINYFSRNADSFIIGKFMSASILGSYNLAYRIMLFPLQSLTFVATRSLYPILSKKQDNEKEIAEIYLNCVFVILLITAPLMSGLAFYSEPFIRLLFGKEWYVTGEVLKWLAPTAIIQAVLSTSGAVFMAKGRTDVLLKLGIIGMILQVGSFLIGVQYSIKVFAICYLLANVLNFFPVMFTLMRLLGQNLFILFKKITAIFVATFLMLSYLYFINLFYSMEHIRSFFSLLIVSSSGSFIYFLAMLLVSKNFRTVVLSKLWKH
ncbi:lipopolysaccharide biosynthesis protein [Raoultella sp. C349492]|uniref:lipopolysaccharide biosynthesis protein n=1 Tax=Raoultella sp. C349492 TaxID=2970253 RepID=UPI0035C761E7